MSVLVSSLVMNPYFLFTLNHFTVPVTVVERDMVVVGGGEV